MIGVALGQSELAPDDVVLGAEIADDVDALDIDARAFVDDIDDAHGVGRLVALEARPNLAEGVTLLGHGDGQRLDRLLDLLGVVDAPCPGQDRSPQGVDIERGQRALDVDGAETVALALVDGEGDEEAAPVAVEIGGRRENAGIGIAVLQIELTQQLAVEAQAVRIVDVGALEEARAGWSASSRSRSEAANR